MLFLVNFCLVMTLLISSGFLFLTLISPKFAMFWSKKQVTKKEAAIFHLKIFVPALFLMVLFVFFFGETLQGKADQQKIDLAISERKEDSLKQITDSLNIIAENKEFLNSSIAIGDIFDKYNENRVSADEAYEGKELIIWGYIDAIEKRSDGEAYVSLESIYHQGRGYNLIHCYLSSSSDAVNLKPGDKIYVKGRFDGLDENFYGQTLKMVAKKLVPVVESSVEQ